MSDCGQFSELKCLFGAFLPPPFAFLFGSLSGEVGLKMPSVFLPQVLSHERKRLLHRLPHRLRGNVCLVSCVQGMQSKFERVVDG